MATWPDAQDQPVQSAPVNVSTTLQLPILTVETDVPATIAPGSTVTLVHTLTNSGSAESVSAMVNVTNPDGSVSTVTAPALAPGATTVVSTTWSAPNLSRLTTEDDATYLARLAAFDQQAQPFGVSLGWTDAGQQSYGATSGTSTSSGDDIPILHVEMDAPTDAQVGSLISVTLTLTNTGHASAFPSLVLRLPDDTLQTVDLDAPLAPGEVRLLTVLVALPTPTDPAAPTLDSPSPYARAAPSRISMVITWVRSA